MIADPQTIPLEIRCDEIIKDVLDFKDKLTLKVE